MKQKALKLDFNERPDGSPEWVSQFKPDMTSLWKYPNREKYEELIAEKHDLNSGEVFLTNGGDEAIELLFKTCKLFNKSILLPLPAFSQYTHNLNVWKIKNLQIPALSSLKIDISSTIENLEKDQWLILTRPNNPTGESIGEADLRVLLNAALIKGTQVLLDEAYVDFFIAKEKVNYFQEYSNVVSLRSFSKSFGLAGARLGYLAGNKDLINEFKKIAMPFNVNRLSLQLVEEALKNDEEVNAYVQSIQKNKAELNKALNNYGLVTCDSQANFILVQCDATQKQLLSNVFKKNKIMIKDQVSGVDDAIRITVPLDISLLLATLKSIFEPQIIGFDMDGVLIDTSESYDQCIQKTVEFYTNEQQTIEGIVNLRNQGGFNNDWELTEKLLKNRNCDIDFSLIKQRFQEYYEGNDSTQGLNSQEKTLIDKALLDQIKLTKAVITGRPKKEANQGIELVGVSFDLLVSLDDVAKPKPDSEGVLKTQKKFNTNSMWFFGDTVDDMQAGAAANCICIGVTENNQETLLKNGADVVVPNVNEGLKILLGS